MTAITLSPNNQPVISKEQAIKALNTKGKGAQLSCSVEELVNNYIKCGEIEGIRWDIALCQAIHETGWFRYGGVVKATDNNYCGLGAGTGLAFPTAFDGAMAHIQHLKAYANSDALCYDMIDPRFTGVPKRGYSPYVEWLGLEDNPNNTGKAKGAQFGWAIPGKGYGFKILTVLEILRKQ